MVQSSTTGLLMAKDDVSWQAKIDVYNVMPNPLLFLKVNLFLMNYIFVRLICYISYSALRSYTNFLEVTDFFYYISNTCILLW